MNSDKKIDELLYRASLRKNFWNDIGEIRKNPEYEIPPEGFLTEPENTGWGVKRAMAFAEFFLDGNPELLRNIILFDDALMTLLKKYELPSAADYLLRNYILNGNNLKFPDQSRSLFAVENKASGPDHILSKQWIWKERGDNYAKLLIHELASKDDAMRYIEKNWNDIKKELRAGKTGKQPRIRVSENRERDALIYKLWHYTDEQLVIGKPHNTRRDIVVRRIVKEFGWGELDPGTIRSIVNKQKKLRRE